MNLCSHPPLAFLNRASQVLKKTLEPAAPAAPAAPASCRPSRCSPAVPSARRSLYEEYRGWVENGKHIEGDPKAKDFFVLNLIGADAKAGINLFEALSQLRVHSRLRRSEMSVAKRLMNANHRDAPHRVDQHGVWVKQFLNDPAGTKDGRSGKEKLGDTGAFTRMTRAGVVGRPGIVNGIALLARNNTESLFNQPFNLPARDTILAYDRAIAHELIGVQGVKLLLSQPAEGDRTLGSETRTAPQDSLPLHSFECKRNHPTDSPLSISCERAASGGREEFAGGQPPRLAVGGTSPGSGPNACGSSGVYPARGYMRPVYFDHGPENPDPLHFVFSTVHQRH
jgi:hypothetical protein